MTYRDDPMPPAARQANIPERIDGHEAHLKQLSDDIQGLQQRLSRAESMLGLDLPTVTNGPGRAF